MSRDNTLLSELLPTSNAVARPFTKFKAVGTPAGKINSETLVGIEVEVENVTYSVKDIPPWQVKGDGSLRNSGFEVVSVPIVAAQAPDALDILYSQILRPECSFSMRTSIHVHVNILDLTVGQIRDLLALYTLFEPALFDYVGRGRWKSVFCVPLKDCHQLIHFATQGGGDVSRYGRWNKYTALNLSRALDIGTAEFRHMAGTFNAGQVVTWIGIITKLHDAIQKGRVTDLRTLFSNMDQNFDYRGFTDIVFEEFASELKVGDPEVMYPASLAARTVYIPARPRGNLQIQPESRLYKLLNSPL